MKIGQKIFTKGKDWMMMLSKIQAFMLNNGMIEEGDRVVVGVSGGADSVCLLHALVRLYAGKAVFVVAHVNHGIRGAEADRDEQFTAGLCRGLGVEFYPFHYDVRKLAGELGISEEEAGRKVRYEAFLTVCLEQKCNKIAVAHNKNDNAETVLFHLFRGTGLKGLSGIEPSRRIAMGQETITLIRPLLCVERKEIEEYLNSEGVSYQVDSTNLTEDYTRNRIRNRILSYAIEEINSGAVGNIHETAGKIAEAWALIDNMVQERYHQLVRLENGQYLLSITELSKEPKILQKGILRKVFEQLAGHLKDLETKHVEAALSLVEKQVGKRLHLPYGILAERGYEEILLYRGTTSDINDGIDQTVQGNDEPSTLMSAEGPSGYAPVKAVRDVLVKLPPMTLKIPGVTVIPQIGKIFETEITEYEKNDPIPKSSCMKWFDYDKIENAVVLRNRTEGDYIQINASGGRKKLKDYFIDHKIPQKQRDIKLLITDGSHVMWIPGEGERMSEKYKVDLSTKKVLLMKMIDMEEDKDDR